MNGAFVPKRLGRGEWITSTVVSGGVWLLRAWCVVGWLIFIPGCAYLRLGS